MVAQTFSLTSSTSTISTTAPYLDENDLDRLFASAPLLVVYCTAHWCGPCLTFEPYLDRLAREYAGRIRVVKLDTDLNPTAVTQLAIRSIPSVLVVREGKTVESIVGLVPYRRLCDLVNPFL